MGGTVLKSTIHLNQQQHASAAEPVGLAVVGLGYWGPNLLRVAGNNLDASVRWICDLDPERLSRHRRHHPGARVTTRLDRVLADPSVDAVVIATPVDTHYDLAARVLEAGKHVFVEKPLAHSSELADELAVMAAERERILMCGHTFLYSPPVRAIKRMISEDKLGDIYFISSSRVGLELSAVVSRLNLGLHQRDINVIWDLAPHDFSILLYWLSEMPTSVRAIGRESIVKGTTDVAFVTLTFASGIIANIELSWLSPNKLRRTVLVGSERMAIYDDGTPEPVRLFDKGVTFRDPDTAGEAKLSFHNGEVISPKIESQEPLSLELADFVDGIRSGERMEYQTAIARSVVRLLEAAERSLREGGQEIPVEQDQRENHLVAASGGAVP
jgi:predicted dehydrogenase